MSNLTKSQKRLLILLVLVLAYAVFEISRNWDTYMGFYKGKRVSVQKHNKNSPANQPVKIQKVEYTKGWNHDPFYVAVKAPPRKKVVRRRTITFHLKAISFAGDNSIAMINSRILKVGDVINGYRLVSIQPKRVVLQKGTDKKILTLK